jgi:DNA polymerase-4
VGKASAQALAREGIVKIGDLRRRNPKELSAHFGAQGLWLWRLANADDTRPVEARDAAKGISAETTFEHNIAAIEDLQRILWSLCEKVSARAKAAELGGKVVALKLRTTDFKIVTRRHTLDRPTQLARRLFDTGCELLAPEARGTRYRLIGIGIADLVDAGHCDEADLFDPKGARRDAAERAMDKVRGKFGSTAIRKGRSL